MATEFYERVIAYDFGDAERQELMRKVWKPTPFMVDAFTGSSDPGKRADRIRHWCHENIGEESWPIHDRPGEWHFGGATVFGWTWMGFATQGQLDRFLAHWKDDEWQAAETAENKRCGVTPPPQQEKD